MTAFGKFYELVTEDYTEEGTEVDVSESALRDAPRNFVLNLANGSATKLAEQLASPDLVLVWLLTALGAPVAFAGVLEPIRRGAATFPQLVVSGRMRAYARHKWFWVGAGLVQAVALATVVGAALTLTGTPAGVVIVGALLVFSLASGVGSVAFSDVLGKTIPERRRGQLLGLRSAVGGGLTIGAGLVLYGTVVGAGDVTLLVTLVGLAAALWAVGAGLFALIDEPPGVTDDEQNTLEEAREGLVLLRELPGFRRFVLTRSLLLSAELAVPYYALQAQQLTGVEEGFGLFVVALGLAALSGSPVWGRVSDRVSDRLVMGLGGVIGALAAVVALGFELVPPNLASPSLFAVVFLVVGLARAGVRVGRKSYIVDAAPDGERPLYVAASNTLAGVLTLAFVAFGVVAQVVSIDATLGVLLVLCLLGAVSAWRMPASDRMVSAG